MDTGQTYHIYNHANGFENLFQEEENYRYFLQQYRKYLGPVCDTYAYCLMPNHFHFLLKISGKDNSDHQGSANLENLSCQQAFSNFFNSYTKAYNKRYSRKGSLFHQNFKRKSIETDDQFRKVFLYIHLNPIKHGFVSDFRNWHWSSWKEYLEDRKNNMVRTEKALEYFDSRNNLEYCLQERKEEIMNMKEQL